MREEQRELVPVKVRRQERRRELERPRPAEDLPPGWRPEPREIPRRWRCS